MASSDEGFSAFMARINSFQPNSFKQGAYDLSLNPGVREKVGDDGSFKPFYGDTVIFDLEQEDKCRLARHQDDIYEMAGHYLAERLNPETFHMTLHDLTVYPGNIPVENSLHYKKVYGLVSEMNSRPPGRADERNWPDIIEMKPQWIFNMNNTSIVYGLSAVCEDYHNGLMSLYRAIDEVVPLPYPFTPHITIAYFKRDVPPEIMLKLEAYAEEEYRDRSSIKLRRQNLMYCRFANMNCYERVV